ncbi:MAG: DUF6325 family protein [Jiangellales bacterium]
MTDEYRDDEVEPFGPIDFLVVEFPGNRMTGRGLPMLLDLVDRRIIRILDLVFIRKETDDTVTVLTLDDVGEGTELEVFAGVSSGLLGDDDLSEAAKAVEPGSSAGVLVYENRWAAPFAAELLRGGAQLVAQGRIPINAVIAALDVELD